MEEMRKIVEKYIDPVVGITGLQIMIDELETKFKSRLAEVERERDETRKKVLQILEENWQAQIAGYYNDGKSMTKECRNILIEEYKDLISIFKHQFKQQQSEIIGYVYTGRNDKKGII